MKKFFLLMCFICGGLTVTSGVWAATREFSSPEEAQAGAASRNREILQQAAKPEYMPQNEAEMLEFLKKRLEVVDVTKLPEGERIDKVSSFSKVDDTEAAPKKSFWEKIYDNAIARVSNDQPLTNPAVGEVQYYTLEPQDDDKADSLAGQMPIINITLPNGAALRAPAYEHIPIYSTQIEILPNAMIKVYENVTVIANGGRVKDGLVRFIKKEAPSRKNKIQLMLDEVRVNGTPIPYELVEQNEYYVLRPVRNFKLPEGVYQFEFRYLADRYLWDYGDFYEFYWDLTGSHFNLLVNRAIAAVKLPGREPAVKRFALTGRVGKLDDKNAVVLSGDNNTLGFMNLYPLMGGESLHLFMTVPKVDFLPVSVTQKTVWLIDDYGDIALSLLYLLAVGLSCLLSWRYIQKRLKFKSVNLSSPLLVRSLWRGAADKKSVGCLLLDLFRRNLIDIQQRDDDILLVRKTVHAKNIPGFEKKVLKLLFSKKDNICKLAAGTKADKLLKLTVRQSARLVSRLGLRLSSLYILFNLFMLAAVETGLCLWNENSLLPGVLLLADGLWLVMIGGYLLAGGGLARRFAAGAVTLIAMVTAGLFLSVYLSWMTIVMLTAGIWAAVVFSRRAAAQDALLKNAVQSAYKLREMLSEQKEIIAGGRNFVLQQANILALDLEDSYQSNAKIKNFYRLPEVAGLLAAVYL